MIVLASGYVGWKVIEYLVGRKEAVRFLVLDERDAGGYNKKILAAYASSVHPGTVRYSDALADEVFLSELERARLRIGILAWWPFLLRGGIASIPEGGWVNFHPGYLPYNRGKHPNFWCLVDGTPCGVTLHYINDKIDGGAIVAQELLEVSWEDTGETIYKRSQERLLDLFRRNFDAIVAGRLPGIRQEENAGSLHLSSQIDDASLIALDEPCTARKLLNVIRARMFPPHPTAYFYDGNRKYSVQVIIKEEDRNANA